jgi:hypothetical protein
MNGRLETLGLTVAGHLEHGQVKVVPFIVPDWGIYLTPPWVDFIPPVRNSEYGYGALSLDYHVWNSSIAD